MLCKGIAEIETVAKALLEHTGDHAVVILQGDLAAGKTTLVQAVAKALDIEEAVTSPTFSLQQSYGEKLYHYDIYNQGLDQFMSLGLFEELEKDGLHFIEWGDDSLIALLQSAGLKTVKVGIKKEENRRCYRIDNA